MYQLTLLKTQQDMKNIKMGSDIMQNEKVDFDLSELSLKNLVDVYHEMANFIQFLEDNKIELKIVVHDTGIGIRKEDMSKLFGTFERLDMKKNRNVEFRNSA